MAARLNPSLKRLFGVPSLDYGMVGRWIGHFPRGRLVHTSIAQASPVRGERIIGGSTIEGPASTTVTRSPRPARLHAAAIPTGPEPMMRGSGRFISAPAVRARLTRRGGTFGRRGR